MFTGTEKGEVYIWDTNEQKARMINAHQDQITAMSHEPQGSILATASRDSSVKIWDTRTANKPIVSFTQHSGGVNDIAISPDGRWVSSAGNDGIVQIWEIDSGKQVTQLKQDTGNHPIHCIDFNP